MPSGPSPLERRHEIVDQSTKLMALFLLILILGGIYGGIFTPTEAAVVGVVYALFTGAVIYRQLTFKKVYEAMVEAGVLSCLRIILAPFRKGGVSIPLFCFFEGYKPE